MKNLLLPASAALALIVLQLPTLADPARNNPVKAVKEPRYTVILKTYLAGEASVRIKLTLAGHILVDNWLLIPHAPEVSFKVNGFKPGVYTASVTLLNTDAQHSTQTILENFIFTPGTTVKVISVGDHSFSDANPFYSVGTDAKISSARGEADIDAAWGKDASQIPDIPLGKDYYARYNIGDTCKIVFVVGSPSATTLDTAPQQAPDLSASFQLAALVDKNDGQLPFSIREAYSLKYAGNMSSPDSFWFQGDLGDGPNHGPIYGHRYISMNSLGKSSLTAKEAVDLLDENIETVFPGQAKGVGGSRIEKNASLPLTKFKLAANPKLFVDQLGAEQQVDPNLVTLLEVEFHVPELSALSRLLNLSPGEVECRNVTEYHFNFDTVPGRHVLAGEAIHGIFKDSTGELWLFQQGRGPADEDLLPARYLRSYIPTFAEDILDGCYPDANTNVHKGTHKLQSHLNYTLAEVMWRMMASNFKETLKKSQ